MQDFFVISSKRKDNNQSLVKIKAFDGRCMSLCKKVIG